MARFHARAGQAGITTGTALKTLMQLLAATNHRIAVYEIGISFRGVVNTDAPIPVDVLRQTTAGTMTSLTPVKMDDSIAETLLTTAQHTASAEPTAGDILKQWSIHPQTGLVWIAPAGGEIIIGGGDRLGLRVTAAVSVAADVYMVFEE